MKHGMGFAISFPYCLFAKPVIEKEGKKCL